MKHKYIFFTLFQFILLHNINSQSFTKEQMLADFDFLYGKLDSVNTRFPIIKKVTNVDILSDIQKVRQNIDTVTCDLGFYDCLYRTMTLCKDMHIGFTGEYPYDNYDKSVIDEAKKIHMHYIDLIYTKNTI